MIGLGLGISLARGGGVIPPPDSASYLSYYEASSGTTLSGSPSSSYGKIDTWAPVAGSGDLVQATDAQRPRKRTANTLVYNNPKEANLNASDTTLSINRRASSFFCLAENDRLVVISSAENKVIMSLPGGVGDLYILCSTSPVHATLHWKDASGTYNTGIKCVSSLALYGVVLGASGIKIVMNDQSYDIGTPLSAGTTTGWDLFKGSFAGGQDRLIGGVESMVWYDKEVDAGELTDIRSWAVARKAVFSANTTKQFFVSGASRSQGYYAEGNLGTGRQFDLQRRGSLLYHNFGFGGVTAAQLRSITESTLGINNAAVGSGTHNPLKRQVLYCSCPTNNLTDGLSAATIIADLATYRERVRAYGYDLVFGLIAPRGGLTGPQETKRLDINAGMRALEARQYGYTLEIPTELQDPSVYTNPLLYDPDEIHHLKLAFDYELRDAQATLDSYIDTAVPAVQGLWSLNGDLLDYSGYYRDMVAIGSPTFTTGLNGGLALVCTSGGVGAAKTKVVYRNYDTLPLTMVCWFQGKAAADDYCMMKFPASGNIWTIQRHNGTSQVRCSVTGVAGGTVNATDKSYVANTWYGAALVIDSVNGARVYTTDAGGDPATFALRNTSAWSAGAVVPSTGSGAGALRIGSYNSDATTTSTWVQGARVIFSELSLAQLQALSPVDGVDFL